jgi:hypothetical protein
MLIREGVGLSVTSSTPPRLEMLDGSRKAGARLAWAVAVRSRGWGRAEARRATVAVTSAAAIAAGSISREASRISTLSLHHRGRIAAT